MTQGHPRPIRGVLFDLDGTLTAPMLDFDAMRREIGITDSPILEALEHMSEAERRRAFRIIERHEEAAAANSELSAGARELLDYLADAGLKTGVVTRNSRPSVDQFIVRHGIEFDALVSRDDAPPKPSPAPLLKALEQLGLGREEVIYVGDHEIDRQTGAAAGIPTYIVRNHAEIKDHGPPEMRVDTLAGLIDVVGAANAPAPGDGA